MCVSVLFGQLLPLAQGLHTHNYVSKKKKKERKTRESTSLTHSGCELCALIVFGFNQMNLSIRIYLQISSLSAVCVWSLVCYFIIRIFKKNLFPYDYLLYTYPVIRMSTLEPQYYNSKIFDWLRD